MNQRTYDVGYAEMESMPPGTEKAIQYLVSALVTDGGHHKTWCAEEALKALGVDLDELRRELNKDDYDWEPGIAP